MEGRMPVSWRVVSATLFASVFVIGAYILTRDANTPPVAEASTETALLQAIAAKDSDNDGLPDWEESLYGTDPHNPDTFHLGMTDGEAVSRGLIVPKAIADVPIATSSPVSLDNSLPAAPNDGTITSVFAKNFFTFYIAAKQANGGADLSEQDMSDVAKKAMDSLANTVAPAPDFKSASDMTVSGSGPEAMKAFAASAELILLKNTASATTTELVYLKHALQDGDTTAYAHIASIAKAYQQVAAGIAALPVPQELAVEDLNLVNSLMRTGQIIADFTRADTDPLATILALQQYPDATSAMGTAFLNVSTIYKNAGIVIPTGTPGAEFVNLSTEVIASDKQVSSPSSRK